MYSYYCQRCFLRFVLWKVKDSKSGEQERVKTNCLISRDLLFESSNRQGPDMSDSPALLSQDQVLLKSPPKPKAKLHLICLPL